MKINQENFREVLKGISLICGGGGGNPSEAEERMNEVLGEVEINDLDDFEDEDVLVSIFGVGGLKTKERNVKKTIQKGLDEFKQEFEIKPAGVIPVEVGAGSVSEALIAANALKLPLANADIVGMRCAPEIYLETITLADISRTPLIAVSPDREIVSIKQTKGYEELEEKLRSLSSNKIWYVMGYPIEKKELEENVVEGWFEKSLDISESIGKREIPQGWQKLGEGEITSVDLQEENGFTVGRIQIKGKDRFDVFVKNENIFVLKNGELASETPENLAILDKSNFEGIYNGEVEKGGKVMIVSSEPQSLWKTDEGEKLFSKENLGFEIRADSVIYNNQKTFKICGGNVR